MEFPLRRQEFHIDRVVIWIFSGHVGSHSNESQIKYLWKPISLEIVYGRAVSLILIRIVARHALTSTRYCLASNQMACASLRHLSARAQERVGSGG